jgi:hypothetical protein
MKYRLGWCAVAVAIAACSEGPTSPGDPQFAKGGTQGPVDPQVVIYQGGTITYRSSGAGNGGLGTCTTGGAWVDPADGTTAAAHPNCATIVGGTPTIATLAPGRHGTEDQIDDTDAYIWYRKGPNRTQGLNTFLASDGWTIDAEQALVNVQGDVVNRTGTLVMVCRSGACSPGLISW